MKRSTLYPIVVSIILSTANFFPQEANGELNFTLESSAQSKYVWRGLIYNTGLIIQPGVTASYNNFNAQVWGSYTVNDLDDYIKRHEIDFIFWYDYEMEDFTISPSFSYYRYPGQEDSPPTAETNLEMSYPVFSTVLYTNICFDILEYRGSICGDFGLEMSLIENEELNLSVNISAGWANKKFSETYMDVSEDQEIFHYINCSMGMDYYLSEKIYIRPNLEYYYILSSLLKSISGNNLINFSLAVGVEF